MQGTAAIPLRMQVSLTGAHEALPALSQCPGAPGRGMPTFTAGIKQPRDSCCGSHQRDTVTQTPGDRSGTAPGPPAQHRSRGQRSGDRSAGCGGSALDLFPTPPPAPRLRDAKKSSFPIPWPCCKWLSCAWHQLGVPGWLARGAQLLPAVPPGMIWAPREAEGALTPLQGRAVSH